MSRPTILLIDYEPQSIEATLQPLAEVGYHVEVAKDGVAAIEAFRRLHPDLVLLEMILPRKHGLEVCQELRKHDPAGRTPIVMMGRTTTGTRYRVQALNSGANDFVPKPIPPGRLLEICNVYLTAPAGFGEPLDLEEGAGGVGEAEPIPQAVAASVPVDLADLSEDEIIARLDAMLPTGEPGGTILAPMAREQRTSAAAEPFETAESAPAPPPEPRSASPEPATIPTWTAPREAAGRLEEMTRPTPEAAPTLARQRRQRRRSEPEAAAQAVLRRPEERAQRGGRPWAWVAGTAALGAAGAVFFLVLRNAPSETGFSATPETSPPPSASALADAGIALGEAIPTESEPAPPPETEAALPAPVPVPSLPEATRTQTRPAGAAPQAAKPSKARPGAASPPAAATPATPPPEPPPLRAEPPAAAEVETPPAQPPGLEGADAAPAAEVEAPAGEPEPMPAEAQPQPGIAPGTLLDLSETDSPPTALTRAMPRYPPAALRLRREAVVMLRLLVDETGRVAAVQAGSRNASSDFVAEATRAARTWTYRPATRDGVPVKVWITEKVVFKL